MSDDDFCNDAETWKRIADSYAWELDDRDDRIDALQARIEQLEAALQKMNDYPMAYDARQILITALEGKKDE